MKKLLKEGAEHAILIAIMGLAYVGMRLQGSGK